MQNDIGEKNSLLLKKRTTPNYYNGLETQQQTPHITKQETEQNRAEMDGRI